MDKFCLKINMVLEREVRGSNFTRVKKTLNQFMCWEVGFIKVKYLT